MNIALCVSGHLRHFLDLKDSYYQLKSVLSNYGNIDTFVCTWNKINTNLSWSYAHGLSFPESCKQNTNIEDVKKFYNTDNIQILNEDFFASKYSILNYSYFTDKSYNWDSRGISPDNIIHCIKTMYLIHECNLMKNIQEYSQQKEYDLVFRLRPDAVYHDEFSTINFSKLLNDKLYTAKFSNRPYGDFGRFAFGSSFIMNRYSSAYLRSSHVFDKNIFGDPERVYYESIIDLIKLENIVYIPDWVLLSSEVYRSFLR